MRNTTSAFSPLRRARRYVARNRPALLRFSAGNSLRTVPFQPEHIAAMDVQPRQLGALAYATPETWLRVAQSPAITVLDGGDVLFCGGELALWPGRAQCWAFFAHQVGHRMTAVCRAARAVLDASAAQRIELDVAEDHAEGHRLARLLGFELETPHMPCFYPDSTAGALYVRVTP